MEVLGYFSKLNSLWKYKFTDFVLFLALCAFEITYLISVEATEQAAWYENIEVGKVLLCALLPCLAYIYVLYKRIHIQKASKERIGILLISENANKQTFSVFKDKFAKPFGKMINRESRKFDLVVLDDFHSEKFFKKYTHHLKNKDEARIKTLIGRYRCSIAFFVCFTNGGEKEELLCRLSLNVGYLQPIIPEIPQKMLDKAIGTFLKPIKQFTITKHKETEELETYTLLCNYIFSFLFATAQLCCGYPQEALELFETIHKNVLQEPQTIEGIKAIKDDLPRKIGFCNALLAQTYYSEYRKERSLDCLIRARQHLEEKYCNYYHSKSLMIIRGICYFVIDKNIVEAENCMNMASNDPALKFNKIFLKLYSNPIATNFIKTIHIYKGLGKLKTAIINELQDFIHHEYEISNKWQLLFLLFLIYDFQGNQILAKITLDKFIANENAANVLMSEAFVKDFDPYIEKYSSIVIENYQDYRI